MRTLVVRCLLVLAAGCLLGDILRAAEPDKPALVEPSSIVKLVENGKHNAFTALVKWKDQYWLAFRQGPSHNYGEADLVVMRSSDAKEWKEVHRVNVTVDDRDPQFLATPARLFLYDPAMEGTKLTSYATYTDDGQSWSKPAPVYEPRFIMWKPIEHGGKYYSAMHIKAEGQDGGAVREVHLVKSDDGLKWEKISTIRKGNWESETTIFFDGDDRLVGFLRQKYGSPQSSLMISKAPFTSWEEKPGPVHFSGHAIRTLGGVNYLLSRTRDGNAMGTMIYTWANDTLTPYCKLPSGGDCSYPEAVELDGEMLVSYYSSHEGNTNIYLARVPLKN